MSKRKPYTREMSNDWWTQKMFYTLYMLREGSSVFVTIYSFILAWGVLRLSQGEMAFNAWMESLQSPVAIVFHLITLLFATYHTVTWFSLAPKAVALWFAGKRIGDNVIVISHYIAFAAISAACLLITVL
ncbi:MAG TPA: fumarate reductase subunit C [Psychromonas hadalis]|nr:fumarate reductase subunit C [Psychromonas hadalis]